jgi:carboxymethylenebutenolidase
MATNLTESQKDRMDLFTQHMNAELNGDLEKTMATMSDSPHLNHVPTMAGGMGVSSVRSFYQNHLVGKFFPSDIEFINVSRTIGEDQIVEELILKFTHTSVIDWMLPHISPTGKPVEIAIVVIIKFSGDKIAHEHIYWDQASVLAQIGLIDTTHLPVCGAESARKVLNPALPSPLI